MGTCTTPRNVSRRLRFSPHKKLSFRGNPMGKCEIGHEKPLPKAVDCNEAYTCTCHIDSIHTRQLAANLKFAYCVFEMGRPTLCNFPDKLQRGSFFGAYTPQVLFLETRLVLPCTYSTSDLSRLALHLDLPLSLQVLFTITSFWHPASESIRIQTIHTSTMTS